MTNQENDNVIDSYRIINMKITIIMSNHFVRREPHKIS